MLSARDAELAAVEADLAYWYTHGPFVEAVARLAAYRGVALVGRVEHRQRGRRLAAFPRRPDLHGLHRPGPRRVLLRRVRRGHITKAGNTHLRTQLIESAWAYQHHPNL